MLDNQSRNIDRRGIIGLEKVYYRIIRKVLWEFCSKKWFYGVYVDKSAYLWWSENKGTSVKSVCGEAEGVTMNVVVCSEWVFLFYDTVPVVNIFYDAWHKLVLFLCAVQEKFCIHFGLVRILNVHYYLKRKHIQGLLLVYWIIMNIWNIFIFFCFWKYKYES